MSSFVKKLMATGAALSIGISSFAVADYYGYNNSLNNNCCPPAPCFDNGGGSWCDNLSFRAAWLYWKASGDDFQYAVEKTSTANNATIERREKFHDISFDLDSGFRVGFGFDAPCQCWGVEVDWTHFHSSSSASTIVTGDATPPQNITAGFPVLDAFTSTSALLDDQNVKFNAGLKLRYDTVDIEFGKWLGFCNGCILFRPHAGFRVADIQENFRDAISGNTVIFGDPALEVGPLFAAADWKHENRFKGFGVRAGFDIDFQLCEGWSIIGRSAASAIWGTTHLKNTLKLATQAEANQTVGYIKEDFHQTRFITDLSLGIQYRTITCCCYPVTIALEWEHHYLFNQHRYWVDDQYGTEYTTSSYRSSGDVALQGLTLTAQIDF